MDIPIPPDEAPKVTTLRPKKTKRPGGPALELAQHNDCRHAHVRVDEHAQNVQCKDCQLFINPIAFIVSIARHEHRVTSRLAAITAAAEVAEKRTRTTCEHCGKMTRIRAQPNTAQIFEARDRIERDE